MKKMVKTVKWTLVAAFSICMIYSGIAQDKSKRPSPPAQESKKTDDGVSVTIDYSQPAVKGRTIWGGLVPYEEVWRTGANEASWIEISHDVAIGDTMLPKGKYGLFTIPTERDWTIIFNKTWNQWGAYEYDASKDVLRITATPKKSDEFTERMTFNIEKDGLIRLNWENLEVNFELGSPNKVN